MIFTYEILNPVSDTKKPFLNRDGFFIVPMKGARYRYYIEAALNTNNGDRNYYLLLSNTKFDNNCRICNVDNYGRLKLKLRGEFKDFINDEIKYRGNVDVEYVESFDGFDVFEVR